MHTRILTTVVLCSILVSATAQDQEPATGTLPEANEKHLTFGVIGQGAGLFYRKYRQDGFIQFGIGGSLNFGTGINSADAMVTSGVISEGYHANVAPMFTFGHARRTALSDRLEAFGGLNYSAGVMYHYMTQKFTLMDLTQTGAGSGSLFTPSNIHGDYLRREASSFSALVSASPFLGVNFFITRRLAIGGIYSFGGFILRSPFYNRTTTERRDFGVVSPATINSNNTVQVDAAIGFSGSGGIMISYRLK